MKWYLNERHRFDARHSFALAFQSEFLQSGGEKSVSVMLYMIALQNMTICPFRCVDEINQVDALPSIHVTLVHLGSAMPSSQGMDPTNERRVFELLVRHSSDKANSQYFLLSPKVRTNHEPRSKKNPLATPLVQLLPNLKYSRKIKLLFVCNGDVNIKSQEWNISKYIERRRALISH